MSKSDTTEMKKRVNDIYLLLLQGFQRKSIIQYCAENYKIQERQVDVYLTKARKLISENIIDDCNYKQNEILTQLYDLYQKNYDEEDFKECRNILGQISLILGVNAPIKTVNNNFNEVITKEEVSLINKSLEDKY